MYDHLKKNDENDKDDGDKGGGSDGGGSAVAVCRQKQKRQRPRHNTHTHTLSLYTRRVIYVLYLHLVWCVIQCVEIDENDYLMKSYFSTNTYAHT